MNIIHQILINDSNNIPNKLPRYTEVCIKKIRDIYFDYDHKLYSGEEIENILKNNFDKDVLDAYKKLNPYAFKADLARYCLLYLYGGIYSDLNNFFLNRIDDDYDFFAFCDRNIASRRTWAVINSIIISKKKSKVLERCINIIIDHCKNYYYGNNCIDVTGSTVLGKSIVLEQKNIQNLSTFGELNFISPNDMRVIRNDEIELKDKIFDDVVEGFWCNHRNKVMSLYKPATMVDLNLFGHKGTNCYRTMWKEKKVYN